MVRLVLKSVYVIQLKGKCIMQDILVLFALKKNQSKKLHTLPSKCY